MGLFFTGKFFETRVYRVNTFPKKSYFGLERAKKKIRRNKVAEIFGREIFQNSFVTRSGLIHFLIHLHTRTVFLEH